MVLFATPINFELTPTPRLFIETIVKAANSVVMTPTTKAAGSMAKLMRFRKWWPKVRAKM